MNTSENLLFENTPASCFSEAYPIGNGHIGGMVYMDPASLRIGLNHDELWTGMATDAAQGFTKDSYLEAQRLALLGEYKKASELLSSAYSKYDASAYLPLGDLTVELPSGRVGDYERSLRLESALAEGEMVIGNLEAKASAFCSFPRGVLVYRIELSSPTSAKIRLSSPIADRYSHRGEVILLRGACPVLSKRNVDRKSAPPEAEGGRTVCFGAVLGVKTDGKTTLFADGYQLEGATFIELVFSAETSYLFGDARGKDGYEDVALGRVEQALAMDFDELLSEHIADHRRYYDRVELHFDGPDRSRIPTSARIEAFNAECDDPSMLALAFNFGRYLMIAGSRSGSRALNLQGIWNDLIDAPWNSNYTTNINTQMNYWPACPSGLTDMLDPLLDLVKLVAKKGRELARNMFGARGIAAGHNADIFGYALPASGLTRWSFFPLSVGWLMHELFDKYLYTRDGAYLEEIYPLLEGVAQFCLDTLIDDGDYLIFCPATSAENAFGDGCQVARSTEFFAAIIREALGNYLEASLVLGKSSPDVEKAKAALPRLLPPRITSDGRIEEWYLGKDADPPFEPEPTHRHISHLYGIYPGSSIESTPELRSAVEKTLEIRGDVSTGWSLGWKMCVRSRLGDPEGVMRLLGYYFRPVPAGASLNYKDGGGVYSNLFCAHPPFQIDGNFAITRAVFEMLSDSKGNPESYLRGLPACFGSGYIKGMYLEDGKRLDLDFKDGKITRSRLYSTEDLKNA